MEQSRALELKSWLEKEFGLNVVDYLRTNLLHKFRIRTRVTTYWLYISREFVNDNDMRHIVRSIERAKIIETFRNSTQPRWVFLGKGVVREVDEYFAKGM